VASNWSPTSGSSKQEHKRFIEQLSRQVDGITDDFLMLRRISMKTSARNQVNGVVRNIKRGAVNDEVELEIFGGDKLTAIITHESTNDMGLRPGTEAFALIKSSSILVMAGHEPPALSARNRLRGTVARIQEGAVNTEVVIAFPGGGTMAAIITNESSHELALKADMPVTALFKASSVILGVPA
jgi:molybdate transport system regulatory protein